MLRTASFVAAACLLAGGVVRGAMTATGARILLTDEQQRLILVDPENGQRTDLGVTARSYDWSPDGDRIAFVGDPPRLWVMNLDGSLRRMPAPAVPNVGPPEWSPDGSRLAFTSIRSPISAELFVVSADGTGLRRIVRGPNPWNPRWSPDGMRLLFVNGKGSRRYVQVVDLRSGVARRTVDRVHPYSTPAWSPDGSRITYVRQRRLFVATANGRRSRRLSDLLVWGAPAWSPDGSRIVFESRRGPGQRADLWSVAPSGADLKRLTRGSEVPAEDTAPAWSPDGAKIAFRTNRGRVNGIASGLYSMNADGSCETQVIAGGPGSSGAPDWRPGWSSGPRLRCVDLFVEARVGVDADRVTRNADRVYRYDIDIVNEGTEPATGVELRTLAVRQDNPTFVFASPSGGACVVAAEVSCRLGAISAGEKKRVVVRFKTRFVARPIAVNVAATAAETDVEPSGNAQTPLHYFPFCRWTDIRERSVGAPPYGRGELVCGTDRDDTILGSGSPEIIQGARGDDRVSGGRGNDTIGGENGDDRVSGGRGTDLVSGGSGDDWVQGGEGRDMLSGGSGNDVLVARDAARDTVHCGAGRDRVVADKTDIVFRDCERVAR